MGPAVISIVCSAGKFSNSMGPPGGGRDHSIHPRGAGAKGIGHEARRETRQMADAKPGAAVAKIRFWKRSAASWRRWPRWRASGWEADHDRHHWGNSAAAAPWEMPERLEALALSAASAQASPPCRQHSRGQRVQHQAMKKRMLEKSASAALFALFAGRIPFLHRLVSHLPPLCRHQMAGTKWQAPHGSLHVPPQLPPLAGPRPGTAALGLVSQLAARTLRTGC